jgi:hypothetical protein
MQVVMAGEINIFGKTTAGNASGSTAKGDKNSTARFYSKYIYISSR